MTYRNSSKENSLNRDGSGVYYLPGRFQRCSLVPQTLQHTFCGSLGELTEHLSDPAHILASPFVFALFV
jgi:hypothetical protein